MISKILEISTAHIPMELDWTLHDSKQIRYDLMADSTGFGWLFRVSEDWYGLHETELSASIYAVMKPLVDKALAHGASFILLDRDAEVDGSLPQYDWD